MRPQKTIKEKALAMAALLPLVAIVPNIAVVVFDLGWGQSLQFSKIVFGYYLVMLLLHSMAAIVVFWFGDKESRSRSHRHSDTLLLAVTAFLLANNLFIPGQLDLSGWAYGYIDAPSLAIISLAFIMVRELTARDLIPIKFNPALVFVLSFLALILAGTGLLLLPNASTGRLSFVDALFTSTSAVCVTGLAVKDTGTFFTPFGQSIIMLLIQLGGLGIMTLSSFLGYFLKSGSKFSSMLSLREMTNSDTISGVFSMVKRIVILTLMVEAFGAFLIYLNLPPDFMSSLGDRLFFSAFHSVSAFCNAGFSTATDGLYHPGLRFSYGFQMVIAMLFITGGFGFPVMINLAQAAKSSLIWKANKVFRLNHTLAPRKRLTVNTRIAFITSIFLILLGTVLFFLLERNNTLSGQSLTGKLTGAFFASVTPRTAGFNTIDLVGLAPASILFTIVLMWIGASPGSTGGGIRTTTFAMAVLRIINTVNGKKRVEMFGREISGESFKKAFSVIFVSVVVIMTSSFLIAIFDPQADLIKIVFESFSAFSTVGLSLNLTATLSSMSKLVLVLTMFFGRVGMLTLLAAMFYRLRNSNYRFPTEDVLTS